MNQLYRTKLEKLSHLIRITLDMPWANNTYGGYFIKQNIPFYYGTVFTDSLIVQGWINEIIVDSHKTDRKLMLETANLLWKHILQCKNDSTPKK